MNSTCERSTWGRKCVELRKDTVSHVYTNAFNTCKQMIAPARYGRDIVRCGLSWGSYYLTEDQRQELRTEDAERF